MESPELNHLRRIALDLPEVNERLSHGAPCFFVQDKRPLCYFHDHHHDDRVSLWFPAPLGVQDELIAFGPDQFFKPPMSSSGVFKNWVGVFLDLPGENGPDWDQIAVLLEHAFRHVAPKQLIQELEKR